MADYIFKFIIIGDTSVGKSCLLLQFTEKQFRLDHETTIGVEFASRMIALGNKSIKLQVWDTAGLENFQALCASYYRGAIAALLVYDVCNRATFNHMNFWLDQARIHAGPDINVMLVGNKSDLDSRAISPHEALALAQKHGLLFLETSAKTGFNVEEAFTQLAWTVLRNLPADGDGSMTARVNGMRISRSRSATASDGHCMDLKHDLCGCNS
mmetsp:Transcript_86783/g.136917  ORF Transcript_86783/g.136917 Transcript_86783/m.136917 type:complete len:212 (+) Transcript_86783:69-704(+)